MPMVRMASAAVWALLNLAEHSHLVGFWSPVLMSSSLMSSLEASLMGLQSLVLLEEDCTCLRLQKQTRRWAATYQGHKAS